MAWGHSSNIRKSKDSKLSLLTPGLLSEAAPQETPTQGAEHSLRTVTGPGTQQRLEVKGLSARLFPAESKLGKEAGQTGPGRSVAGMSAVWDAEWIGVLPEAGCKDICKHGYRDLEVTYGCLQAL